MNFETASANAKKIQTAVQQLEINKKNTAKNTPKPKQQRLHQFMQ